MKKCKNNKRITCLLQLKDTEYAIKNKLIDLLSELKGFKPVTKLVSEFKKNTK